MNNVVRVSAGLIAERQTLEMIEEFGTSRPLPRNSRMFGRREGRSDRKPLTIEQRDLLNLARYGSHDQVERAISQLNR